MHERDIDSAEIGSPNEDANNFRTKIGAPDILFASAWRMERDDSKAKAVIICFIDMGKKKASLSQNKGTQG